MAALFLGLGVLAALAGSWLTAALLVVGAVGAVSAFRKGTWDTEQAQQAVREYARPRLIGGAIGLVLFVIAVAVGLLD